MAYSDYGGYGYLNGQRVEDRSDAVISEDFDSIPGLWPGIAAFSQGMNVDEFSKNQRENPNGHVVLGEGPVYVGLYKQSSVTVWIDGKKLSDEDLLKFPHNLPPEEIQEWVDKDTGKKTKYFYPCDIEGDYAIQFQLPGCHTLHVKCIETDNIYLLAKLEMPNGDVWTGFSGYGVGAGLEDADYGYDTAKVEQLLFNEEFNNE